jgi:UDP-2-acetamido-3-amino-2,3-dideoxy-glucuronate N-acetyltransferase
MYIHRTADVAGSVKIGSGTKIWHEAQVRGRVVIGQDCILGKGVYVDEDVNIGSNVKIQNRASIYKDCTIEDGVFIGPHVCFTNDVFPRAINPDGSLKSADDWTAGRTLVRYGASIGAGAIILPNRTIGRFAMIGAGSVVTRDVPDHGLVVGNPARLVGHVCYCGARLAMDDGTGHCLECKRTYRRFATGLVEVELVEVMGLRDDIANLRQLATSE